MRHFKPVATMPLSRFTQRSVRAGIPPLDSTPYSSSQRVCTPRRDPNEGWCGGGAQAITSGRRLYRDTMSALRLSAVVCENRNVPQSQRYRVSSGIFPSLQRFEDGVSVDVPGSAGAGCAALAYPEVPDDAVLPQIQVPRLCGATIVVAEVSLLTVVGVMNFVDFYPSPPNPGEMRPRRASSSVIHVRHVLGRRRKQCWHKRRGLEASGTFLDPRADQRRRQRDVLNSRKRRNLAGIASKPLVSQDASEIKLVHKWDDRVPRPFDLWSGHQSSMFWRPSPPGPVRFEPAPQDVR
ncbi:hypothetical protein QBC34DRAFT_490131 [Podospora aff. communis PSN243]|uniref:Uncharacterized protein n=1 Tax=Podospora aff. communis PSN243 TaxID=3040156 RepID=A0AAV9H447_9PEZI|nr:hypothetical protein QBC34DRAFT_490131 [Podospora aff. communis PSN243]